MCCQVANPHIGCFVLLEVNVNVDEIKIFFTVFLIKKSDQLTFVNNETCTWQDRSGDVFAVYRISVYSVTGLIPFALTLIKPLVQSLFLWTI